MIKKTLLSLSLVATVALSGCNILDISTIGTIDGSELYKKEFAFLLANTQAQVLQLAQQEQKTIKTNKDWNSVTVTTEVDGEQREEIAADAARRMAVEAYTINIVLAKKANDLGIFLDDEAIDTINKTKQNILTQLGSRYAYEAYLEKFSLTENDFTRILQNEQLAAKVRDKYTVDDEDFKVIPDEDIKAEYEQSYRTIKHILIQPEQPETPADTADLEGMEGVEGIEGIEGAEDIEGIEGAETPEGAEGAETPEATETPEPTATPEPTETPTPKTQEELDEEARVKAQDILDQIQGGADFDQLMKEFSTDPGLESSPNGYTFTKGQMVKEFEEEAFALDEGSISPSLVKTTHGFHILKREPLPTEGEEFDSIKTQIESTLLDKKFKDLIDQWSKEYNLQINQKAVDAVKMV